MNTRRLTLIASFLWISFPSALLGQTVLFQGPTVDTNGFVETSGDGPTSSAEVLDAADAVLASPPSYCWNSGVFDSDAKCPLGSSNASGNAPCTSCTEGGSSPSPPLSPKASLTLGQPGAPQESSLGVSEGKSSVTNITQNMMHWATDYSPHANSSLNFKRVQRTRDTAMQSSLGRGGFTSFDVQLIINPYTRTFHSTDSAQVVAEIFNPESYANIMAEYDGSFLSLAPFDRRRGKRLVFLDDSMSEMDQPTSWSPWSDVSWLEDAKYAKFELLDDGYYLFELISETDPNAMTSTSVGTTPTGGRLIEAKNVAGDGFEIEYKTFTSTELTSSPSRLWQIDTITDELGNTMEFTYHSSQVGGLWAIDTISLPESQSLSYEYSGAYLSTVKWGTTTKSTFSYANYSGLVVWSIDDLMADARHRSKDVYINGGIVITNGEATPTSVGMTRMIVTDEDEVVFAFFFTETYEGGGRLRKFTQSSGYADIAKIDGWTATDGGVSGSIALTSTDETEYAVSDANDYEMQMGVVGETYDARGIHKEYLHDSSGNTIYAFYDDDTFESFCYNSRNQVTRYRDRNGHVTLTTYDSSGRKTEEEVGLKDSTSNQPSTDPYGGLVYNRCATDDVQTSEYASRQWQYYTSGNGTGKVSKYIDELGNETDYTYNAYSQLVTLTEPPDVTSGTRAETTWTYDTLGRVDTVTDPEDHDMEYVYDARGRLISTIYDDGSTEQRIYGTSGAALDLIEKTIDRNGVVTKYEYDSADRLTTKTTAYAQMNGSTETTTPSIQSVETWEYLVGTNQPVKYRRNGALEEYAYDYRGRLARTTVYPVGGTAKLETKRKYVGNQLFYQEDPYGRRTYFAYDATDGRPIRTVMGTTPEFTLASYAATLSLSRDFTANADYVVNDSVLDSVGNLERQHDGRNMATEYEYDSRDRPTAMVADADYTNRGTLSTLGTALELRTETDYDLASHMTEVRSPRYFDSGDTGGYQKAKETWTYTNRGLQKTHSEAPGASEAATESFTYYLDRKPKEHTDFRSKVWTTHEETCCGLVVAQENPLGDGTIRRTDSGGRAVHAITVEDYSSHTTALDNPVDAKTLREVTTKYDGRYRPVARTTWLVARGTVDIDDPPIAGLGGVSAAHGLTEQYLYDDNLADSSGLDSSGGAAPLIGSAISLDDALTQLADTEANGGAGISFDSDSPGTARVMINGEGEVSFTIADAAGRTVMTGTLDPSDSSLITWNCGKHDETTTVSGYGTVLVSKSINALGNVSKQYSDAAGRTIRSIDALGKITSYEYDATGNQTKIRDPNSVGQDCTYDALGRDLTCTDTASDATSSAYDDNGNKISQTDAKSETTTYAYDARNRQIKVTDRLAGETEFAYLATGQLSSLTDAENRVTSYSYDDAGHKLTETYPDHTGGSPGASTYGIVTFTLDPAGRVLRKQDQNGDTVTSNYDLAGRLTSRDYRTAANSPSGTIADSDTFAYDDVSRMLTAVSGRYGNTVTYTYDAGGRKATEALTIASVTYTTTTEYDDAGQVATYTYPDGTEVDRAYTDRGQLSTIALDSTTVDTRSYDDGGRMTGSAYNNGVTESRSYNNDNTLASISYTGASIGTYSYTWDENKNKLTESISGTMTNYGFDVGTSGYDDEDRLVNWERDDSNLDQSWSLSLVGDWNSITENTSTQNRTHGPSHEMLTAAGVSVSHDVKGNMTSIPAVLRSGTDPLALSWDFDNRLTAVDVDNDSSDDVTYQYDALGRRVQRDDGTTARVFVQNGQQTFADYTSGTAAGSPTYNYLYASYIDEPVVRDGSGGLRYFHRTQQFSISALTDSGGTIKERYAYSAYGELTITDPSSAVRSSTAEGNRYTYTGREWDDVAEIYHYRARMYDPVMGRFLARDPIGYEDATSLYEYVRSSPVQRTDSNGQQSGVPSQNPTSRGSGGCSIQLVDYPTTGGTHVTIRIRWHGSNWITDVDGTQQNGCTTTTHHRRTVPLYGGVLRNLGNKPASICACIAGSCGPWNQTPASQRERSDIIRNSNWAAKCFLKRCGLKVDWDTAPWGWNGNTGICIKRVEQRCITAGYSYYPCVKYQECPDGFGSPPPKAASSRAPAT